MQEYLLNEIVTLLGTWNTNKIKISFFSTTESKVLFDMF